jgi:hypothetical protein
MVRAFRLLVGTTSPTDKRYNKREIVQPAREISSSRCGDTVTVERSNVRKQIHSPRFHESGRRP